MNDIDTSKQSELTEQERNFCLLFMNGEAPYGGNATKCYQDVFSDKSKYASTKAKALLKEKRIKDFIATLEEESIEQAKDVKRYLTKTYMKIIDECSDARFTDRHGNSINPAAMRSVAVNAGKALADLYPVKEAQVSKLNIGAGEDGQGTPSVTFNVIVPGASAEGVEVKKEEGGER